MWRPLRRQAYQPWWTSNKAQSYGAGGLAKVLIAENLGGIIFADYANDRDHIRW